MVGRVDPDPQRDLVYAAEAEIDSHRLPTIGDVQRFLDGAMGLIREEVIPTELATLDDARVPPELRAEIEAWRAHGHRLRCFGLAAPDQRRILVVDAGQEVLSNGLNALHEATHILVPTPEEPHGPTFVRAWLDFLDRFGSYQVPAVSLAGNLQRAGVRIDKVPSRLWRDGDTSGRLIPAWYDLQPHS